MNYRCYAKVKDTPVRRARKGLRNSVFQYNMKLRAKADRERRAAR